MATLSQTSARFARGVSRIILLFALVGGGGLVACQRQDRDISIRFAVRQGAQAVSDARFYVHAVSVLDARGGEHPVRLRAVPQWQNEQVALLDMRSNGSGLQRAQIDGAVERADYVGLRFALGVPFTLNHANPLTASPPLNRGDLFWSWQSGYKFLRLDAASGAFHLGSTACSSASALRPPNAPCAQPNLVQVELRGFDPTREAVQVDWQPVLNALAQSAPLACTGDYARIDACAHAYAATGLDIQTGLCAQDGCPAQRLFLAPRSP